MTWHLRDTSSLLEVTIVDDHFRATIDGKLDGTSRRYLVWVPKLLHHLSVKAPALRSLDMMPGKVLPSIGALSQLEALALSNWSYSMVELAAITHLIRLQNLKVTISGR